jgi:hypothetical protein
MNTAISFDTFPMRIFEVLIIFVLYWLNVSYLGEPWDRALMAGGGAFTGACCLAYFRRDPRKTEQAIKIFISSLAGSIAGAVAIEFFHVENEKYCLGIYFVSGLLILALMRALLNMTERNAAQVCRDVLQRFLNTKLEDERPPRTRGPRRQRSTVLGLDNSDTQQKETKE